MNLLKDDGGGDVQQRIHYRPTGYLRCRAVDVDYSMYLVISDLYPLCIARKSGGGLHCDLHVPGAYRSP